MTTYQVKRSRDRDLSVTGRIIAEISGKRAGSMKWTELRIYKTEGGSYVVSREKHSELPGEKNLYEAQICSGVDGLLDVLMDNGQLGRLSKEALEKAAENDDRVRRVVRADPDVMTLWIWVKNKEEADIVKNALGQLDPLEPEEAVGGPYDGVNLPTSQFLWLVRVEFAEADGRSVLESVVSTLATIAEEWDETIRCELDESPTIGIDRESASDSLKVLLAQWALTRITRQRRRLDAEKGVYILESRESERHEQASAWPPPERLMNQLWIPDGGMGSGPEFPAVTATVKSFALVRMNRVRRIALYREI